MKILHVANHFYPCIGGVERNILDLCEQLIKKGHTSDALCLNKCSNGGQLPPEGKKGKIKIFRVPFIDMKYYKVSGGVQGYLKGYDAVHIHGMGYFLDLLASTKTVHRKKLVFSTHGGFFHTKSLLPLKKIHLRTLTKISLKQIDKIIAVSKQDNEIFSKISSRVEYIPNGIDCSKFRSGKKEKNTFVYVGRIAPNKRIDNLVRTFTIAGKMDSRIKLRIIGKDSGNLLPGLRKIAGSNITFKENVTEKEKLDSLAKTQFFVSASEYEGFGLSVLEGMASGCIPILNSIPAFRNLTADKGLLVDYSRPEQAAKGILEIARSGAAGAEAQVKQAERFDWKNVIRKWEQVYS